MIKIDYIGLKCGVCGKDFTENDDVVVCPECGTPMHRDCYKENNGCPNAEKHGSDFVFEGFDKITKSAKGISGKKDDGEKTDLSEKNDGSDSAKSAYSAAKEQVCPMCGEVNKHDANFCNRCGARFVKIQPIPNINPDFDRDKTEPHNPFDSAQIPPVVQLAADPLGGIPADEKFDENVTAADLACYVSVNSPYYMRAFYNIRKKMKKFNFSALVFSGVWFLYRKLYKLGSLIFSIEILLYVLRFYFSKTYSLNVMNDLFAKVGLSVDKIGSLNMEQYTMLSQAMQELSATDQLVMMIPSILFIIQLAVMIVCGIVANKVYYNSCIKNVRRIKKLAEEQSFDKEETSQAIYLKGGVNPFVAGVFCLLYFYIIFL